MLMQIKTKSGSVYWGPDFDGVGAIPGVFERDGHWWIDLASIEQLQDLMHPTHWPIRVEWGILVLED